MGKAHHPFELRLSLTIDWWLNEVESRLEELVRRLSARGQIIFTRPVGRAVLGVFLPQPHGVLDISFHTSNLARTRDILLDVVGDELTNALPIGGKCRVDEFLAEDRIVDRSLLAEGDLHIRICLLSNKAYDP